jgi:hypothetical protein
MKRKLLISIVSLFVIIAFAFYLNKDISYKELSLSDEEINSYSANTPSSENPTTGIEERGFKTNAIIIGEVGQQVEIVSISKSEDVGIDVFYKITKSTDSNSKRSIKIASFINLFGKPVGFKELD